MENIKDLESNQIATKLIKLRAEKQTLEAEEKMLQDELKQRSDFEKYEFEWIRVTRESRRNITLRPDADIAKIKERYPELVTVKQILDTTKISEAVFNYIKSKDPEAIVEDVSVDATMLHNCTRDYTDQKITTFVKITWMWKSAA